MLIQVINAGFKATLHNKAYKYRTYRLGAVIIHNFKCKSINLNNYDLGIIVNVRFEDQLRNSLMTSLLTHTGVFLKLGFGESYRTFMHRLKANLSDHTLGDGGFSKSNELLSKCK